MRKEKESDVVKRLIKCRKEIEKILKESEPLNVLLVADIPIEEQIEAIKSNLPIGYTIKLKNLDFELQERI